MTGPRLPWSFMIARSGRHYSDGTLANAAGPLSRLIHGWALTADSLVTGLQS